MSLAWGDVAVFDDDDGDEGFDDDDFFVSSDENRSWPFRVDVVDVEEDAVHVETVELLRLRVEEASLLFVKNFEEEEGEGEEVVVVLLSLLLEEAMVWRRCDVWLNSTMGWVRGSIQWSVPDG